MHPSITKEAITLGLLILFITLFYLSVPPMLYLVCFLAVALMFIVLTINLLTKTDRDEREERHHTIAADAGFAVGGLVLMAAIAKQTFIMHSVDPELFVALVAMFVARLIVRVYLDKTS